MVNYKLTSIVHKMLEEMEEYENCEVAIAYKDADSDYIGSSVHGKPNAQIKMLGSIFKRTSENLGIKMWKLMVMVLVTAKGIKTIGSRTVSKND